MQITLKRTGEYSVRAMIHVARHDDDQLPQARQIASGMQIPYKFLTQILARLVAEGLLQAKAGPYGGYLLARPATDITLLEIIQAAEGPTAVTRCVLRDGPCDWDNTCPIHDTWTRAQTALTEELAATTLADLADLDPAIQTGTHQSDTAPHSQHTSRHGKRN